MAFSPIENRLGIQPIGLSSAVQNHDLGTIVRARDQIYGEGEFIYLKGVAGTVIGSAVTWDSQSGGVPAYQTALAPAADNLNQPLGVAMAANVAGSYGWYQIEGMAVVATNGALSAGGSVYLAGAGQLTSSVNPLRLVFDALALTSSGTPSSGKAIVEIARPFAVGPTGGTGTTATVTTATYTILSTDTYVFVNRAGTVTLTLPDAATWLAANPSAPLTIKDISGAAGSNNITINRAGADTIDGLTSLTITSNYGGFKLRPSPTPSSNWAIVG